MNKTIKSNAYVASKPCWLPNILNSYIQNALMIINAFLKKKSLKLRLSHSLKNVYVNIPPDWFILISTLMSLIVNFNILTSALTIAGSDISYLIPSFVTYVSFNFIIAVLINVSYFCAISFAFYGFSLLLVLASLPIMTFISISPLGKNVFNGVDPDSDISGLYMSFSVNILLIAGSK